ncbi:MAG: serine/threonine-protein kinase [Gemmatimonadetes bacterium]|nr:protein kinase [Gemmatimonadota bacterium]NNM05588.1 serine/threonine-protein kinase [Gemmatimonadota bacterium]
MDEQVRLAEALADRYRIEREIGAGGMATVYLAQDLRHDRNVAIKVLRPELAAVIGAERFLAEIKVTANLQHPHILPLHDSGESDGFLFYVMPFIEGESLRDRLERETQLSIEDAFQITQEVAYGLSHAHSLGIVHRDIKPANILLSGGHALVADFGIARAVTEAGGARLTETGLSLGTPHYMSPEQASGEREIDARSDEYALGCVLFEMLVGEPPHTGPNAQAVIAKVLTEPVPSVRKTRELVHPQADAAIGKALAKLPADRFATVQQFAEALQRAGSGAWDVSGSVVDPGVGRGRRVSWGATLAWSLVAALGASVATLLVWPSGGPSSSLDGPVRLVLDPRPADSLSIGAFQNESGSEVNALAISADGRSIAFVGRESGEMTTHLYLRSLDGFEAKRLPETESAASPFFSPDGEWLGFYSWSDRRLKKMPVTGGVPQVICACDPILSAHWGPDDLIVMDTPALQGLRVVPGSGGTPEEITSLDLHLEGAENFFGHPQFLPDGQHVLFTAWGGGSGTRRIALVSLESGERTTLLEEGWAPLFVESGHLVFQRMNQLWAAPFDLDTQEITGTPLPVVDSVFSAPFNSLTAVSANGTLVYAPGPVPDVETSIHWVERSGQHLRIPVESGTWTIMGPNLSPDGGRVAFAGPDPSGYSAGQTANRIWIHDIARGTTQPITDRGGTGDFWPIWTPDGRSVVFTSAVEEGGYGIFRIPADGSGPKENLYSGGAGGNAHSWVPENGDLIIQRWEAVDTGIDIWQVPMGGPGDAVPLVEGPASEFHPSLSPDGRWLAYVSDQSGQNEIYLSPYPGLDEVLQISTTGGMGPLWRSDSRELYFFRGSLENGYTATFMRVPIDDAPGSPEPILEVPSIMSVGLPYGKGYDVTPDGQRFLVAVNEQEFPLFLPDLRMVFNWFDELNVRFER